MAQCACSALLQAALRRCTPISCCRQTGKVASGASCSGGRRRTSSTTPSERLSTRYSSGTDPTTASTTSLARSAPSTTASKVATAPRAAKRSVIASICPNTAISASNSGGRFDTSVSCGSLFRFAGELVADGCICARSACLRILPHAEGLAKVRPAEPLYAGPRSWPVTSGRWMD
jgi:hypothetical protein